jgi:hypothetical protein
MKLDLAYYRRQKVNRCYETMTRVCVGVYTVRVWTETRYQKFGPNEEVMNAMYLLWELYTLLPL